MNAVMKELLLGIDLGTTDLKCVVVEVDGTVIFTGSAGYSTVHPASGWSEQEPDSWWECLVEVVSSALASDGISPEAIKSIGISSQSSTVLAIGRDGKPLHRAIIWMDSRAREQQVSIQECMSGHGSDILVNPVQGFMALPKLLWVKENQEKIFDSASVFLQANSYLVYRLTGETYIDASEAGLQQIVSLETGQYSKNLCSALGIPAEKLPRIVGCEQVVGSVSKRASNVTGLKEGTPVVAGTIDTVASALGAGVGFNEQVFYSAGTSGNLCFCSNRLEANRIYFIIPHAIPGLWLFDLLIGSAGSSLRWFKNEFFRQKDIALSSEAASFDMISEEASKSVPNTHGPIFLPYLVGRHSPDWNIDARGAFWGISIDTTRQNMIRSIMEGCAFELLHNIESMENQGSKVSEVRLVGGITRSEIWNQIWADVLQKNVIIPDSPGAALGAAILAGKGVGFYSDTARAASAIVKIKRIFEPVSSMHSGYARLFDLFKRISKKLDDDFADLAR